MTRTTFSNSLQEVEERLRLLHARADRSIVDAMDALLRRDLILARAVCENDDAINRLRFDIEEDVLNLVALQQPVAVDLRELLAVNSIASNLERIADYGEGIARIAIFLGDDALAATEPDLWRMADVAREMLSASMRSFIDRDQDLARETCDRDDELDELYTAVHRHLLERIGGVERDAAEFDAFTHVIWCSHNLERIGDRATNICERALFMITGHFQDVNVSRY